MVGDPKTISELARLDANPVLTCRRCDWSIEFDRDALVHERILAGQSQNWRGFCAEARCERCGAPAKVTMRPFVSDRALATGDLRAALVFKAVCVLEEAQRAAIAVGPVRPSPGLRFALAYLYAVGDRRREWFNREPYVEFWQLVTKADMRASDTNGVGARTAAQACVNGIARAAGLEITPDVGAALLRATGER